MSGEGPIVSHGRGGKGNIGADPTPYVDGEIVRQGPEGDQGDGAYSVGRGGAGNIGSPRVPPTSNPHDTDIVPEIALRPSQDGDYHVGRGGQGNVHHESDGQEKKKKTVAVEGLADKLKNKLFGRK
ncbi:hypothetical protein AJ80_02111 [Polytolypa hystricis UAMH7299]|uniref:DUF3602 domain-containing protein n=1 Tax=Polytolypa hystricis (strain UAMH7299) TaxID=1447883 RepID=A0A2B7YS94_POLH7|nr:hypothetical protein AJ80_02111 [Polytolypa hystricis UAMH7299]